MLSRAIDSYLATRRALGFRLVRLERYLRSFAEYAKARREQHVRSRMAIEWARLGRTPPERDRRIQVVIRFAFHAHAEDPRHEVPPRNTFGRPPLPHYVPYIYSPEEVRLLVSEALRLPKTGAVHPRTLGAIFSLLAATGMRSAEALGLRLDDVTADGLIIRMTKFRKSRLVPIHESAVVGLQQYLDYRRPIRGCDHLFVTRQGQPVLSAQLRATFVALRKTMGLDASPRKSPPRIHDLRHTFAVRSLEFCRDREHVGQHMLALSTYLGHSSLASTFWYLHGTPRLMATIAKASEVHARGAKL
jgi:integrase